MTGATEKSKSTASKADEKELEKLHRQDFWLRIQRTKLLLDLLFVCTYFLPNILLAGSTRMTLHFSLYCLAYELFNIKPMRNAVKPFAGLGAAFLRYALVLLYVRVFSLISLEIARRGSSIITGRL